MAIHLRKTKSHRSITFSVTNSKQLFACHNRSTYLKLDLFSTIYITFDIYMVVFFKEKMGFVTKLQHRQKFKDLRQI